MLHNRSAAFSEGNTDVRPGKMVNVGHGTIAKARKVAADGPELATKSGDVRLDAAYKHVMGKGPGRKSHIDTGAKARRGLRSGERVGDGRPSVM
jgi:hypothetical protein